MEACSTLESARVALGVFFDCEVLVFDLILHVFFVFIDLVADLLVESAPFAFVGSVVGDVTKLPVGADLFEFIDAPFSDDFIVINTRRLVSI